MPIERIESINDDRLNVFRDMRTRNWTRASGRFVVEGALLTERLLDSTYECDAILIDEKYRERFEDQYPSLDIYCLPHNDVRELVGFDFHRGIMASGLRKELSNFADLTFRAEEHDVVVVLCGIEDPENLGGILRSCAGMGARRVVIGPGCCDPFSRRALRVAMGTTFSLSLFLARNLKDELRRLRVNGGEFTSYAAALTDDAVPLANVVPPQRSVLLFGNERNGLPETIMECVDCRAKITMAESVSSLNVGVAAGIFLYHFQRAIGH